MRESDHLSFHDGARVGVFLLLVKAFFGYCSRCHKAVFGPYSTNLFLPERIEGGGWVQGCRKEGWMMMWMC